ncbi:MULTISPECIES: nickel/cobalt transporter [unclassified Mesorhizobium]|uniref:nickel/cobalt transporter n=1 Tax=unclassified Mesorhizobium TaxID=325217 RepID=UPI000FCC5B9E|nr:MULTISPECIES: nickel/cobalt transporter [unclassified Mesorhizobium]TGP23771.1 delayed-early response protein/equilibrative nucleoside transporter [Mesorhizobium sp. M1D.F.Ca.ET.231.01.1.1]TGP33915.1 delayed-early response protein/equilibrative nucleoside transporter [Mesorhizobium sp. M1D.F.Ca.ET.234.01.1.1]TGS47280.1 delayed-early response protein/equilibrative nucleoside transporter [Mesorhizobium sp. M1D.F.Ca.ET.184.01.1.1]TGS62540.1 delayed-early response protein/equilibrative nucleosid
MKQSLRLALGLAAATLVITHLPNVAHAQSSLGIGTNDGMVPTASGPFAHILMWINLRQQEFYHSLAAAMKAMRQDGSKLWLLVGLSFAYGIFHAAGPGHGKAVISSYMVANEVALKRGIMLSFVSALLQGLTAVVVMVLAYFVLRGTAVSMTDAAWFLEISSFVLVTLFGAWLLWRKAGPAILRLFGAGPAYSLSAAHAGHSHGRHSHDGHSHAGHSHADTHSQALHAHHDHAAHAHSHEAHDHSAHDHHHHDHAAHDHDHAGHHHHGPGEVCETCGHSHAPDPALLSGDRFDWKTAWSAVAAVGIRPCSGALIVLSFALLNGLWLGGLLSVLAMSIGTAITVSALATIAVTAKNWAVYFAGDGRIGNRIHSIVEIGGAAFIFLVGLLLLSASLTGGV